MVVIFVGPIARESEGVGISMQEQAFSHQAVLIQIGLKNAYRVVHDQHNSRLILAIQPKGARPETFRSSSREDRQEKTTKQ